MRLNRFDSRFLKFITFCLIFFFITCREKDIGDWKAKVAAEFVMKRCPGTKIAYHTDPIQDFDMAFYEQFQVIIAGLDNVEARRWINGMVHRMVTFDKVTDEPEVGCMLIDGGTEGFMG